MVIPHAKYLMEAAGNSASASGPTSWDGTLAQEAVCRLPRTPETMPKIDQTCGRIIDRAVRYRRAARRSAVRLYLSVPRIAPHARRSRMLWSQFHPVGCDCHVWLPEVNPASPLFTARAPGFTPRYHESMLWSRDPGGRSLLVQSSPLPAQPTYKARPNPRFSRCSLSPLF